ncbi:MAG: hypothetical protein PHT69_04420 [Bacteroidales bacterium]|nr:hypothetical protein [Bacteroidales bacterium]
MGLKKGQTNNPEGRKKGTPNKATKALKEKFEQFINDNLERLQSDFDLLEPKDRLNFITKLASFIVPPPVNELELLTDEQLDELIKRLKNEK